MAPVRLCECTYPKPTYLKCGNFQRDPDRRFNFGLGLAEQQAFITGDIQQETGFPITKIVHLIREVTLYTAVNHGSQAARSLEYRKRQGKRLRKLDLEFAHWSRHRWPLPLNRNVTSRGLPRTRTSELLLEVNNMLVRSESSRIANGGLGMSPAGDSSRAGGPRSL